MLIRIFQPKTIAVALCFGLASCETYKDKIEICRTLMEVKPNADIEVTEFARDSGFLDETVYCRFETSSKVLDDIFVTSVADAIVRKTTFARIKPKLAQPEWWSAADSDSDKWSSRPIENERRVLEFVFIENAEGFTVLGLAGSF